MLAASLSSSTPSHEPQRHGRRAPPAATRTSARTASGLCAPSSTVSGSRVHDLQAPGTSVVAAASRTARSSSSIPAPRRYVLRGGAREREVAPLKRAPRRQRRRGRGRRSPAPAARSARRARPRRARRPPAPRGASQDPSTSVPPARTTASFSSAMSLTRRPQPARVLQPDVREHRHAARRSRCVAS